MPKPKEKIENQASQEKPCNHFMVWNIQGGYSYYRCDKCNYIDGKKTFAQEKQKVRQSTIKECIEALPKKKTNIKNSIKNEDVEEWYSTGYGNGFNQALQEAKQSLTPLK